MDRIKHNLHLKLISLALSVIACIAVNAFTQPDDNNTIAHRVYTLPIKFVEPGNDLVYSTEVKEVVVTVSGSLSQLNRISPELLSAEVNLSGRTQPGNNLESINVMVPGGITMTSADPTYIWVKLSKLLVKQVPVRVELQGQVAGGYSIGKPEVAPESVRITGADTVVESVVALRAPLAVAHANSTFSAALRTLLPVNSNGEVVKNVKIDETMVSVTVPIYTLYRVPVDLSKIKVATMSPKQRYTMSVEPKTVLFASLNHNAPTSVFTQPQTIWLDKDEAVVTLPLDVPRGVSLASGVSGNVVVTVTKTKAKSSEAVKK